MIGRIFSCLLVFLPIVLAPAPMRALEGETGLPLPRFVSLKANRVNLRRGPGWDHAILWVFQRKGLPVEVISEFGLWRQVRDSEGDEGWIFHSLLDGTRHVLVTAGGEETSPAPLYKTADGGEGIIAWVEPGVVGRLLECAGIRCRLASRGVRGWMDKTRLWGVYPHERPE